MFQKIAKKLALIFGSKLIKKVKSSLRISKRIEENLLPMWENRRKQYEKFENEMGQKSPLGNIMDFSYNASRIEELSRCIMDLEVTIAKGKK